jgi:NADPH-dependent 2,4-dienoyl-CoA reductase/sulfur reductase-like enzyme
LPNTLPDSLHDQARVACIRREEKTVTDRSTAEIVTIIGAGIGGLYLAAELGIAGFKLRLHDIDDSKLSEIRARGGWM